MKAIIFDFDGVILDSVKVKTLAFADIYKEYGAKVQEKVVEYHLENGGISRFEKFKYFHKNFLNIEISNEELTNLGNKFSSIVFEKVCSSKYIEGASEFLEYVNKKYLKFICTGTPYNEIIKILKFKKIEYYFDDVYGSPMTKNKIIREIIKKYSLRNDEIIFIGDAMTDYNAAKSNNINFVGVKNDETVFPQNTLTVKNLTEIIKLKNI